jgi:hypothetical protein
MKKFLLSLIVLGLCLCCSRKQSPKKVLIVQDEMPAVKVLAHYFRENKVNVEISDQPGLPKDLSSYDAVVGYIHFDLDTTFEKAIINYTEKGGRYVCLHHSISSGKAFNKHYFDFLGIRLDNPRQARKPVEPGGGYGYRHNITLVLVNLNPGHYITSHKIDWTDSTEYSNPDIPASPAKRPALLLEDTEIYLNHKFTDGRDKTLLCGIRFHDDRNDQLFMQNTGAWIKNYGQGQIVYFQAGHRPSDYKNQNIAQMILNSVNWRP